MPTIWENIRYFFRRNIAPHAAVIKHLARWVAILLGIALILEIFVFNFNYFASAGYKPINLKSKIDLYESTDDSFWLTAVNHEMEFSNLNTRVHNIRIDFDEHQPAQNLTVKIQFTDEAHLTYFDSTEYTVGVPEVNISTNSTQSEYINLNSSGLMNNLKITITGDEVEYPIKLWTVSLNAHHPFDFNTLRFSIAFGVLLLIFMFRPQSAIYRIRIVENPKESKAGMIAANIVEVALIASFLFYGSNLVGIATSNYNYGEWDGASLVNTFEVGGDNAQQYAELARSMANGKLYLEEEPPQWLQDMSTPYDKGARDEAQKATGEEYLFDVAYYEGHYYVYFGVVPVLLFYLPFYLITGANFPTAIGILIAVVAFVLGCSALLDRFARYHFKRVSLGLYLLLQIAMVACCGVLYLVKFPTFYSLPIACGLAFSVWGLYFWVRGRESKRRCACFLAGSFCMAFVAGCRPQLLLLSLLAFPLFWRAYITKRRILTSVGMREFACLIAPYIVVAAGIMLYNFARFGSFTDFGANYNLTVNDMTKRGWNVGRLAPAFFSYFLQPPNMSGVFPFIQPTDFATTYMGQTIKEATFGGIFACLPVLWIVFFARPIVRIRNAQRSTRTITGVICMLLISGVAIALVDAEMAGILQRYYADFSFMFLAAVVLLVFIVNENTPEDIPMREGIHLENTYEITEAKKGSSEVGMGWKRNPLFNRIRHIVRSRKMDPVPGMGASPAGLTRNIMTKALIVVVTLSVLYSVLLCIVPETGWYSDIYPWAYQDVLEMFQFWT